MLNIPQALLEQMYLEQQLNPYEISSTLKCDHKTVRRYLKLYNIPLRNASEYNYISHKSHINPTKEQLLSKKSIAAHTAYLCEGWHTPKTNVLFFCNTDTLLCDLIIWCLINLYKVKTIRYRILARTKDDAAPLQNLYPDAKFSIDSARKTPLLRIYSGGKTLARDFVKNAYDILTWID